MDRTHKRGWKHVVAIVLMAAYLLVGFAKPAHAKPEIWRLEGPGRYDTMEKIVKKGFSSSTWAVIATGENFPDALAASALAGAKNCPVILTESKNLTVHAWSLLKELGVSNAYIMGGPSAMSNEVETGIHLIGITTSRVADSNRIATSVAAFNEVCAIGHSEGSISNTVIIATGEGYADTLSIGPWAWRTKSPILLTKKDGMLTDEEVNAIQSESDIDRVVIVGGTKVVSPAVEAQLGSKYEFVRLDGANRYETSAKVAEWIVSQGMGWSRPTIATGEKFPDALSGAALAGTSNSVLMLVSNASNPTVTLAKSKVDLMERLYVLGGVGAIPWELVDEIVPE